MAISAFGIRIDVARIRIIMHTSEPRGILEYAQESDRTSRDRKSSETIVIKDKISSRRGGEETERLRKKEAGKRERAKIKKFLKAECQQKAIDLYLNDRMNRERCESGEEKCQKCERKRRENKKGSGLGLKKNGKREKERRETGSKLE